MEVKRDNTDRRTPSAITVAKKHGISLSRLRKQLAMGAKIEREHTHSDSKAREIARDHLAEIPDYYTRLKKMEREAGVTEAVNTRAQLMHKLRNMNQRPMFPKQKNRKIPYVHRATGWQAWLDITPNEQYKSQKHDPLMRALLGIKKAKKKQKEPLFSPQQKWIPESYMGDPFEKKHQENKRRWGKDKKKEIHRFKKETKRPDVKEAWVDPLEVLHNANRARILQGAKEGKYWLLRSEGIEEARKPLKYKYSTVYKDATSASSGGGMREDEREYIIRRIMETTTTGAIGGYPKPMMGDQGDPAFGGRNRFTKEQLEFAIARLLGGGKKSLHPRVI
jgi:hypothetical protein